MGYKFDKKITKLIDGEKLEYGFIFGNENIVFIKAGSGETIGKKRDNLQIFIELAKNAHKLLGATIICSSNPYIPHNHIDEEMIRWAASSQGFDKFNLYLWGTSDGAYSNLALVNKFPETVKYIGHSITFKTLGKFKQELQALPKIKKFFILGSKDDDFDYIYPILTELQSEHFKTIFVEGAGHSFHGMPFHIINSVNLFDENMEKDVISTMLFSNPANMR